MALTYKLRWKPERPVGIIRRKWRNAMGDVANQMAVAIQSRMVKVYPPAGPTFAGPPAIRTGRLRGSIRVTHAGDSVTIHAIQYGKWLEEGTSKMSPRPFIRPVVFTPAARKRWLKRMAKVAKKGK